MEHINVGLDLGLTGVQRREEALLAAAASLDDGDRFKSCKPVRLKGTNGTGFDFRGVRELLKNPNVAVDSALLPPDAIGEGGRGSCCNVRKPAGRHQEAKSDMGVWESG